MKRFIIIILFMALFSCGQWRISSLNSKRYAYIDNGNKAGNISVMFDGYALNNLSFDIRVLNDRICTADNNLTRLQILDSSGKPELIIGSSDNIDRKKVKTSEFKFSIIGKFTLDEDGNIYVQNRFIQKSKKGSNGKQVYFSPSYILVFDKEGKLQYTLGQSGKPEIPFYYIESLDVDENERLFVISKSFNTWKVFRFKGRKRDFYADMGKIDFTEKEDNNVYKGRIENIQTYQSGDKILLAVAFYHGLRLKYTKVFSYSIKDEKIIKTVINIPDPKNVLFNIVDDKYMYFWNNESKVIKFMICNFDGNIINNKLLYIKNKKDYYSRIIGDKSGKLFSYHVSKKGIEILNWE
ncbi:hypothetical protein ACFL20_10840 [Spirochaetota bacterium]